MAPNIKAPTVKVTVKQERAFRFLWLKYVRGFNPQHHCARCLAGHYSKLFPYAKGYVPPGGTEEDWGAGYTGGTSLFVDPFATAPARIEDARRAADGAEALPPGLRAQVYGWMLDANFEYFIGVGPIPPELPPGIARLAPGLAALHQDVTARLMGEFARAEQEMTEG